jgi:5-methyltetrahydrofolate--homocysteine methyltransferase
MKWNELISKEWLLMDGAMGTELQKKGLGLGELPEDWNILYPERVTQIHRAYVEAGSQVVSTNTFGANPYKLKTSHYSLEAVIKAGIHAARAAQPEAVALDVGPIGKMMAPLGEMTFDEAYDHFKAVVRAGQDADFVLFETFSDLNELRAGVLAAKEHTALPVVVSMTFQEDGRTLTGVSPEAYVCTMEALGVSALGVNCSLGPEALKPIVSKLLSLTGRPVIVQANAGMPSVINHKTCYDLSEDRYKSYVEDFVNEGVSIIGGCCGTSPDHIAELSQIDKAKRKKAYGLSKTPKVCSSRRVVAFDDFVIIGEKINPTGRKTLRQALKNNQLDYPVRQGIQQVEAGASILDVNVGVPGLDEVSLMKEVVDELGLAVDVPLQIDSGHVGVVEDALRHYPGVGIINSVNGKEESMAAIFPIAKKYGAMVIALTMDQEGIPHTAKGRFEIAKRIIERGQSYGIPPERLIIDPLCLTVSAQQKEVQETLKAIEMIKSKYPVKTVLGISNVSYGMPNRSLLTSVFLTMAIQAGLDAAIMDPTDEIVMESLLAHRVLMNQDVDGHKYIERLRPSQKKESTQKEQSFFEAVLYGYEESVRAYTTSYLKSASPLEVVDQHLIPTLDLVGQKYESKEIFLPQLMRAAETIGIAFDLIKSVYKDEKDLVSKGKIVMATVQGDVHDLGKNLVKMLLENYGFEIIDLGKDVAPEKVLETVEKHNVDLVGLSALMTTTVVSMAETIDLIKRHRPKTTIFVGGAVLTETFAKEIGADAYCKDGRASVELAQRFYSGGSV